jgi:LEA14-like dessication related protein
MRIAWLQGVWLLLLGGCTPLGLWMYEDPVVTVSRITVQLRGYAATQSPVVVALSVKNANDYPLSTEQVELSLRLDGVPIGQIRRDSLVQLATDTISTVAVPLKLEKQTVPQHLQVLGSGTHSFAVKGRATFRTPIGTRKVRFAQEGLMIFGARSRHSSM